MPPTTSTRLLDRLPASPDPDELYTTFVGWVEERGVELYPAQDEAIVELVSGANVIVATPTGSGKSLVAVAAHFAAVARGERTFYTAPIKALVSEKFFDLCDVFGAESVGMMTGDAAVNPQAPIICCTAEVLANLALRGGARADVGQVVMDEFHYYADPERGWAWQVPLLELPGTQFVLMSATLGDVRRLADDLTRRTGRPTAVVRSATRPVPLAFEWSETTIQDTIERLLLAQQAPVYVVHPTQAAAVEQALALMSVNVCTRAEKDAIAELIGDFRFTAGFGKSLSRLVRHGLGVHHAGMLPKYRRLVERLAQAGLLKVVCGTDTLGVGINLPIRTVVFTGLAKFDGRRTRLLQAREFHQIAGRAGRAGFDVLGTVVAQAPEHVVENVKALAKAGDDPKARRKVVRKKPAEGAVTWGEGTFQRLQAADPEPLSSRFQVSHAMVLNVIARPGDAFAAMRQLLLANDEPRAAQRRHIRKAIAIYRALLAGGVVERLAEPDVEGRTVRLTVDLQADFALNQPLSPFALATLELLDPDSPTYALDVVSVLEATLDDPRPVLLAQEHRARADAVSAMKAAGIEYEERMARLQDISWPKPQLDLLEGAYELYRQGHPWVSDHPLRPKSVVREMFEQAMTFPEYVHHHGLARSEGILLRYLSGAAKALVQSVPEQAKTEELLDLTAWLQELVRQTDASLLDEWEALAHPDADLEAAAAAIDHAPPPVTANPRAFRVLVRNALFRRVELLARRRWADLGELDAAHGWTERRWFEAMVPYFAEHDVVGIGPAARGPAMLLVEERPGTWRVRQLLDDPEGFHEWAIDAEVDLAASDARGEAVVVVTDVGRR